MNGHDEAISMILAHWSASCALVLSFAHADFGRNVFLGRHATSIKVEIVTQAWANCGPRVAYGSPSLSVRPEGG